jgi:hypothetical protein
VLSTCSSVAWHLLTEAWGDPGDPGDGVRMANDMANDWCFYDGESTLKKNGIFGTFWNQK